MRTYKTQSGYEVRETADGLDISINGQFRGELSGKSLDDYIYEDEAGNTYVDDDGEDYIDESILEEDIEEELGL